MVWQVERDPGFWASTFYYHGEECLSIYGGFANFEKPPCVRDLLALSPKTRRRVVSGSSRDETGIT